MIMHDLEWERIKQENKKQTAKGKSKIDKTIIIQSKDTGEIYLKVKPFFLFLIIALSTGVGLFLRLLFGW